MKKIGLINIEPNNLTEKIFTVIKKMKTSFKYRGKMAKKKNKFPHFYQTITI